MSVRVRGQQPVREFPIAAHPLAMLSALRPAATRRALGLAYGLGVRHNATLAKKCEQPSFLWSCADGERSRENVYVRTPDAVPAPPPVPACAAYGRRSTPAPLHRQTLTRAQFDLTINNAPAGRITFALYDDVVPKVRTPARPRPHAR